MKVTETRPSSPGTGTDGRSLTPRPHPAIDIYRRQQARQGQQRPGGDDAPGRRFSVDASVLGIPEPEVTPRVEAALEKLLGRLDDLQQRLEDMSRRQSDLEYRAHFDPLSGLPNVDRFLAALDAASQAALRETRRDTLIYLELADRARLAARFGHECLNAMVAAVGTYLGRAVAAPDLAGYLGHAGFAVLLVNAGEADARRRAADICGELGARGFDWHGVAVAVDVLVGVYELVPGQSAAEAVKAADRRVMTLKENRHARHSARRGVAGEEP